MIRLTQFAVKEKSVIILLAVGVLLAGIFSWNSLRQELLPDIEFPFVTIITPVPGAGAEDVASEVTEPVEQAISNVARLQTVQSTSGNSLSLVFAEFDFGTDLKETLIEVEQAVGQLDLPQGSEPQVSSFDFNSQPIVVATIGAVEGADPVEAAQVARTEVAPALQGIEGVSTVDVTGGPTPILDIVLDPEAMAETGISLQQVQGILFANQITLPSGAIDEGGLRLPVSTSHRFASVAELESLIVGARAPSGVAAPGAMPPSGAAPDAAGTSGASSQDDPQAAEAETDEPGGPLEQLAQALASVPLPVTLGEIATIEADEVQVSGYARTNGQPSLTLSVTKGSGANTVAVASEVEDAFAEVEAAYADVVEINVIQNQAIFIEESTAGLVQEGLLGALFAVLVIFTFLRSVRTTLVAAISIPLSIFLAIAIFGIAGLTINILTLGGLAVAVGRVVDDSIVVLENIYRHRGLGDSVHDSVITGTREVAGAITSSTITTAAVFLPIGFVGGIVSQFFLPFGLAVSFALLASLLVALTVIPVLAYWFVDKVDIEFDSDGEPKMTIWQRLYTPVVIVALKNRLTKWGTLAIAGLLFLVAISLAPLLPTGFVDAGGENILTVTISPPQGESTEGVREKTIEAEQLLLANPDVELVQSTIPGEADTGAQALQAAFSGRASNSAIVTVRLTDDIDLEQAREDIKEDLQPLSTDGFDVAVSEQDAFGGGGGLQIVVSGLDPVEIEAAADALVVDLSAMEGVDNVESDAVSETPQVAVIVDPSQAALIGSSTAQIGSQIRDVLVGQQIGTFPLEDGTTATTVLRVSSEGIEGVESLRALPVSGQAGTASLGDVASVEQVEVRGSVTRVDGSPAATVSADITSVDQGAVSQEAQSRVDALYESGEIPETVTVTFAGATAEQNEAFGSLFFSMGVAVLVVYIVMVLALGSLITPFIILFSLPLAIIGAIPALLITGNPLGISALIGFLMLIGIVVTNAIVLLDFVEQLKKRGFSDYDALVRGANTRVRPILMTAIATILALSPVAVGFAHGSIIAEELATVVIGGLFSSTFLTLIVVPVIYSLVDGGKEGFDKRFRSGTAGEEAPPEAPEAPAPTPVQG
ncbi:MAG: efflux RND transporter permease subunit [Candidatus Limnocylindrales bacterium]